LGNAGTNLSSFNKDTNTKSNIMSIFMRLFLLILILFFFTLLKHFLLFTRQVTLK